MPFKKGQKKIGGRQKGTPNKGTDLRALCDASGVEPFQILLDLCKSRDEGIKLGAAKEASKYLYTQTRATEITGKDGAPISAEVQSSDLKELFADFKAILHTKFSERKNDPQKS